MHDIRPWTLDGFVKQFEFIHRTMLDYKFV